LEKVSVRILTLDRHTRSVTEHRYPIDPTRGAQGGDDFFGKTHQITIINWATGWKFQCG
jgi:hypothetical protein